MWLLSYLWFFSNDEHYRIRIYSIECEKILAYYYRALLFIDAISDWCMLLKEQILMLCLVSLRYKYLFTFMHVIHVEYIQDVQMQSHIKYCAKIHKWW